MSRIITLMLFCAAPTLYAVTTTIDPGGNLQLAFNNANDGDTIIINGGTYQVLTGEPYFHIDKAITVITDKGLVTLQAPTGADTGLAIRSSGISVTGSMTINGGSFGVSVQAVDGQSAISGISLTALTVNPSTTGQGHGIYLNNASNVSLVGCVVGPVTVHGIYATSPNATTFTNNVSIKGAVIQQSGAGSGIFIDRSNNAYLFNNVVTRSLQQHGIYFSSSSNGTIENSTVVRAYANGIFLDLNSNNNLVMGTLVQATDTQHAYAVKNSNSNTLAGNTVTGSGFHGIELIGASYNRVERNSISGHLYDGIVLTPGDTVLPGEASVRPTLNNYIAKNIIVSAGLSAGRTDGTGIWLNEASNGTYVFGNSASGVVEAGLTSFNSSYSYIKGNDIFGNGQAGILWWNTTSAFPAPTNTVFHYNYSHDNRTNANLLIRGANNNDIAHNFLSGTNNPAQPKTDGGIMFQNWTQSGQVSGGSSGNQIYLNIVKDLAQGNGVDGSTNNTTFFQNRYINTTQQFSLQPAGVQWDASRFLGGNYWNGTSASGNPSSGDVSFFNFIIDSAGHLSTDTGPYEDKFPYISDNLGKSGAIAITLPAAGAVMAAGSRKTIAWKSLGCVFVNVSYNTGGGPQTIVSNHPDFGFYHWTLPSNLAAGTNYSIQMTCLNGSGVAFGTGGTSGVFTVGTGDLMLQAPGPELMANAGSTVRVGWRKSGTVTGVNVLLASDGGAYTTLASNISANDYVDVTLPAVNSNRARILVQAATNSTFQDGTDGFFTIRSGSAVFTSPVASTTSLNIGSVIELEWISRQNSYFVDLDLWNPGVSPGVFQSIVANLPDYGKFTWFVPELWMTGAYIRATFKDANRNVLGTVNSSPFSIFYTASPGSLVPFYRLYSDVTKEHLYTTDQNEYNVLGTRGWTQEGLLGQIASGPMNISGVLAIPFYRLYDDRILNHLWTTDRNEYFTLRPLQPYHAEGVVGYLFPTPVTLPGCSGPNCASIPLNRLVFRFPPHYHLWTTDQNEVNVLTAPNGGWNSEGVVGHLFSASAPQVTSAPIIISKNSGSNTEHTGGSKLDSSAGLSSARVEVSGVATQASRLKAVVNGASYEVGHVAPGETVSLFGEGLGPGTPVVAEFVMGGQVPRELGGTRVLFDGSPAPVLYSSHGEVKAIVPNEMAGKTSVRVEVQYQDQVTASMEVKIGPSSPGIFTADLSGKGQAVAINTNGSQNSAQSPAALGSVITLFATGEGLGEPALNTGELPSSYRLPQPVQPVAVEIGGLPAEVLYAGAVPGLPGAVQVRVRIPEGLGPAATAPVIFKVGSQSSQPGVTVSVQ